MRAARSLAIAASSGSPRSATSCRGVGGRRRGDGGRPGHGCEQAPALVERGRVRADDADRARAARARGPDEAVPDGEDGLAGDRERRVVQEVVRLVDRAR